MTDTELREALVDLAAFILWSIEHNGTHKDIDYDILGVVSHDVHGLSRRLSPVMKGDEFFVPRSAGYSKEFKPGAKEAPPF